MKEEINPQESPRANAFSLWMTAPMPMITLVKTINIIRLRRLSKQNNLSFNMLMCWCVGKAATQMEELFTIPENGKLFHYDCLAINVIVKNRNKGINSCDIPFNNDIKEFNKDYQRLTKETAEKCQSFFVEETMIIGTSAMIQTELDCVVNQYTEKFANPMVMWGKYRKTLFKCTLPVSLQFHHVQMDGSHGAQYLENLQQTIKKLSL